MIGYLYVVATPIGNLGDITNRAIQILEQVDLIASEDTRRSKILLNHLSIDNKMVAYHEHNEGKLTSQLIEKLIKGESIALISDAGTPLISDPGYRLVTAAYDNNITVIPIPGPSAVIASLSAVGLPLSRFVFEGYLSAKAESRKKHLKKLGIESRTMVFFETPHRIIDLINDMYIIFGPLRRVAIARELTKQYEQIVRGTISSIKSKIEANEIKNRGEFVVIVEGIQDNEIPDVEILRINRILSEKISSKDSIKLTAKITRKKKNEIYKLLHKNE